MIRRGVVESSPAASGKHDQWRNGQPYKFLQSCLQAQKHPLAAAWLACGFNIATAAGHCSERGVCPWRSVSRRNRGSPPCRLRNLGGRRQHEGMCGPPEAATKIAPNCNKTCITCIIIEQKLQPLLGEAYRALYTVLTMRPFALGGNDGSNPSTGRPWSGSCGRGLVSRSSCTGGKFRPCSRNRRTVHI